MSERYEIRFGQVDRKHGNGWYVFDLAQGKPVTVQLPTKADCAHAIEVLSKETLP